MTTRFRSILTVSCMLVAVIAEAQSRDSLKIVKNGRSEYAIIVGKDTLPITIRAARDLQHYLQKSTGAKLAIQRLDVLPATPCIVVGDCAISRNAGVDLTPIPAEGFILRTIGSNLFIAGRDTAGYANSDHWRDAPQAGTWHGVSHFLETCLDIRWFFPGDEGEYVPHRDSLVVPPVDFSDAPKMIYRRMNNLYSSGVPKQRMREVIDWKRRNRNGWSIVWQASHSWIRYFKGETYFKQHPEWFALVDGRRLRYRPLGLQMCTTNQGALDEFARIIIEYGNKNPGIMFSLTPNDGGNHCECKKCRALDTGVRPDGSRIMTDRYLTYCNEIARRVCKVHPGQTFGFYAYSFYEEPPLRTRVHPNVFIMNVMNDVGLRYYSPKVQMFHLRNILLPWRKQVEHLFFYSFTDCHGNCNLPVYHMECIRDLFKNLDAAGIVGFEMCNCASFAASGLDNYLYLKMVWNPGRDIDVLYTDALEKCFGDHAAMYMRAYFSVVEKRMKHYAEQNLCYKRGLGMLKRFPDLLDKVYPGLHKEGMPLLRKAIQHAEDPGQRARIQLMIDELDFTETTVKLYQLSKKVVKVRNPSLANIKTCRDLARKRKHLLLTRNHSNFFHWEKMNFYVKRVYRLPFDPDIYEYLLSSSIQARKHAYVRKIKAPEIDGKLDDDAWGSCEPLLANLNNEIATPSEVATWVKLAHDDKNLYIAGFCQEPLMAKVKDSVTRHDGKVWDENEMEFFIDTNNNARDYYQLCVNTLGTIYDAHTQSGKDDVAWQSGATVAVVRSKDSWSFEMAIPLSSLGKVRPGDIWGFNACRVRRVVHPAEYTCWRPTFGGFQEPRRFGKVIIH